jgi:uncharacterized repeat protein (TIGR03803 family)
VLYNFAGPPDGGVPYASMVYAEGTASGSSVVPRSALYGTTYAGGTGECTIENEVVGCGTVFLVTEAEETVLYSFQGQTDGAFPIGGLVRDNSGNLYGTTATGGAYGYGTVFRISGRKKTILYSFKGNPDGAIPASTLLRDGAGNFYGTTSAGGGNPANGNPVGAGTVFKLDANGNETVLYSFCSQPSCADGFNPESGLIMDGGGNLYGTTYEGGSNLGSSNGSGTLFKLDTTGHETVLYAFCSAPNCADGANPEGGLITDADGNLYGTTYAGGNLYSAGLVFKFDTTGHETALYAFCSESGCADGKSPTAGLIMDTKGNFYGTTLAGGSGGTVFELETNGALNLLHSFTSGSTGPIEPVGGLVMDAKGNLYGTASEGGPGNCNPLEFDGCGAVFEIKP